MLKSALVVALFLMLAPPASAQSCQGAAEVAQIKSACAANAKPDAPAAGLGGAILAGKQCPPLLDEAMSSLFAYDDTTCTGAGARLDGSLTYVGDALANLSDNFHVQVARENVFASLYCDTDANLLLLSFRGSTLPTAIPNGEDIKDWVETNIVQHLGEQPLQYQYAYDLAQVVMGKLSLGGFDNLCGKGRPNLILTGHSKGGGQAQYAAILLRQKAIVFNSDAVNPVVFIDDITDDTDGSFARRSEQLLRAYRSARLCRNLASGTIKYNWYYQSGAIRDIRMVNDPLVQLFTVCRFAHAPMEWLIDTTACSAQNGHSIASLTRELQVCAARKD